MEKRAPLFKIDMLPIAHGVPQSIAASIGRTIARQSYVEWMMANCIHMLLEISIKQGRVIVKVPRPNLFVSIIKDLLAFHKLKPASQINSISSTLDAADRARNILAHSVLIRDKNNKIRIQIVRGSWDLGQEFQPMKRALLPETPILDRAFLTKQRKAVEKAVKEMKGFHRYIQLTMSAFHGKRNLESELDRRLPSQS